MSRYEQVERLLSPMRARTFRLLCRWPESTAAELVTQGQVISAGGRGLDGNIHARLGELIEQGAAEVVGERQCRVTGHIVNVYAPTRGPVTPMRKRPKVNRTLLLRLNKLGREYPEHYEAIQTVARLLGGFEIEKGKANGKPE